jgi:hypothetical protein
MFRYITCAMLLIFLQSSVLADELTQAKYSDIKKLIDITGSSDIGLQIAAATSQGIFSTLKAARPDIPDRALEVINREMIALFKEKMNTPGGLIDQNVYIYDKYFSHAEIKELLAFYQTNIGKKVIARLPKVLNESMMAGERWAESLLPEFEKRIYATLKREGILPTRTQK